MTPVHPIVEALLQRLDSNLREAFEERAGIMQFEAGHPRELAEALAMLEVIRTNPLAVSGLNHLRARFGGEVSSFLYVSPVEAPSRIGIVPFIEAKPLSLNDAVRQMGSIVVLRALPPAS